MLCDICESLNLSCDDFVIQPEEDKTAFERTHDLGSLQLIREKSKDCPLCRLIVEAIGGPQQRSTERDHNTQCQLYWQEDGFLWGNDCPQVRCLRLSAQPWPPSFNEFNRLIPLADNIPNSNGLFFGRRIKETSVDVKRIKQWMRLCQRWHGEDCEEPTASPHSSFPTNFRVIDAWNRCIVPAPPNCKFLALSYVWGSVNAFKLTKGMLPTVQATGGLNRLWTALPRTIQDAISLTSMLSVQYIWIDSLCIIQDDSVDKETLITYMHMIYDRAFMTIVAAEGKDAHAGLPGVRPSLKPRNQTVEGISPGLKLMVPKHIVDGLNQSVYESRGWT
jgi:hypothetical protein